MFASVRYVASPRRPASNLLIPMALVHVFGNHFPIRPGRQHLTDEPADLSREFALALSRQYLAGRPPTAFYLLPGVKWGGLSMLSSDFMPEALPPDFLRPYLSPS